MSEARGRLICHHRFLRLTLIEGGAKDMLPAEPIPAERRRRIGSEDWPMKSVVPLIPRKRVSDIIERLQALMADTDARGFGMITYFVDCALIEAEIQQKLLDGDAVDVVAERDNLWRRDG